MLKFYGFLFHMKSCLGWPCGYISSRLILSLKAFHFYPYLSTAQWLVVTRYGGRVTKTSCLLVLKVRKLQSVLGSVLGRLSKWQLSLSLPSLGGWQAIQVCICVNLFSFGDFHFTSNFLFIYFAYMVICTAIVLVHLWRGMWESGDGEAVCFLLFSFLVFWLVGKIYID